MADSIRILHVEDDADFADLTAEALEREDSRFDVSHAQSAGEGRERLADGGFDCIVSDYDMPDQNGIEFLERVRTDHSDLPFILFTGKGSEAVASDAIHAGVTDYLQKETGTDQFGILANRIANAVEGHRSQQTLAEQNHELRIYERIFNTMQGGACLYDPDGRFQIVNEFIADFYGATPEELEGEQSGLVARIREAAEGDPYQELLDGERSLLEGEIDLEGPNEGRSIQEYRLTPLTVDGTVEGVVAVARDVTERVEREQRLEQFASVVSHDLRSPLNVADGRLQLAREECDSDHLDDVARAHGRMEELIENVLALARSSDDVPDPEPVELDALVERCWRNVQTAEATLEVRTDSEVLADRSRVQQLIENLVRNAVEHGSTSPGTKARQDPVERGSTNPRSSSTREDATEHGGADVTVTVGDLDDGFYVEDDGRGIPDDEREQLFDDRGPNAATGLGLTIVEHVVEAHGWTVEVAEGTHGGARFEIRDVEFVGSG